LTAQDQPQVRKVSLTFDNGPDASVTPRVLDELAKQAVGATFFTLGKNLAVPALRKLAERAFAEGHRLGTHTYHHATPLGLLEDPGQAVNEILAADTLLGELGGTERLFRPFGGGKIGPHLLNRVAWDLLAARRFTCVLWSVTAPERDRPDSWVEPTLEACETEQWSVVVLHDIPTGAMRHLGVFLRALQERGVKFTQDFPSHCTPLRRGEPVGSFERLMPAEILEESSR